MDKVLITTKKLDARLSRLFLSYERATCINLGQAIENFLLCDDDQTEEKDWLLELLNKRLGRGNVVESHPGLLFKLPNDHGLLTVDRVPGYVSVMCLDISVTRMLNVHYWL